ncbi:MAG: hypothetical protein EAX96_17235 [Candidatus Lokiarchaeota archaeon]|nr:hypothetical protein [Candidatus Lokiarchaeota archaeon]
MEIIEIKYDKNEIIKSSPAYEICYKCSACAKFCPITANVSKYDIENSFIVQLFSADKPEALNDVWMCCSCEKCVAICPQDADPTHVFTNLKEKSYKEKLAPKVIYSLVTQLLNTGCAFDVGAAINRRRKALDLKELAVNEKVVKELQTIANKVGLKGE